MVNTPDDKEFPEIVIGPSRAKFVITMAIMSVMTGGAYWVVFRILTGATVQSFPIVPLLVCGISGLVASIWMLLSLHARLYVQLRLKIDHTGVSDPSEKFGLGTITWAEIQDIRIIGRKHAVALVVDDKRAVLARMHPLRRPLIWFDSILAANTIKVHTWRLDIGRDQLLSLLTAFHREFGNPRK